MDQGQPSPVDLEDGSGCLGDPEQPGQQVIVSGQRRPEFLDGPGDHRTVNSHSVVPRGSSDNQGACLPPPGRMKQRDAAADQAARSPPSWFPPRPAGCPGCWWLSGAWSCLAQLPVGRDRTSLEGRWRPRPRRQGPSGRSGFRRHDLGMSWCRLRLAAAGSSRRAGGSAPNQCAGSRPRRPIRPSTVAVSRLSPAIPSGPPGGLPAISRALRASLDGSLQGSLDPPLMGPSTPPLMGPSGGEGAVVASLGPFPLVRTLRYVGVRLADGEPVDGPPSSAHSGLNYGDGRLSRPYGPGALSRAYGMMCAD
jgi:hypothetical protein